MLQLQSLKVLIRQEWSDFVRDFGLSKQLLERLSFRLKDKNLLHNDNILSQQGKDFANDNDIV